jgi:hypothetical protein
MKYTDLEKHAIASLIIRIFVEEKGINEQNKMHLLDILHFIGMSETEFKSIRGAYDTQKSVYTILQMPKEKRLDFFIIILRLAGRLGNMKYKNEYTPEKMAAFFLIIKTGCFEDISGQDLIDVDMDLHSFLVVIKGAYWETVGKQK